MQTYNTQKVTDAISDSERLIELHAGTKKADDGTTEANNWRATKASRMPTVPTFSLQELAAAS
jgi:hypothetical protein